MNQYYRSIQFVKNMKTIILKCFKEIIILLKTQKLS